MQKLVLLLIAAFALSLGCKKDKNTDTIAYDGTPYHIDYGSFPPPNLPVDNLPTVQKVALARMLFYDNKLSGDGTMNCASCHRQEHAFSDTAKLSLGILGFKGKRQAMAAFNLAWHTDGFFWDGRAHTLSQQSLMPVQDSLEMHQTLPNMVANLQNSQAYADQFMRAFGSADITAEKVALALTQFMHTIVSTNSKYDRYLAGSETLTPSEARGEFLFFTEYNPYFPEQSGADCAHCHSGPNFGSNLFANNGLDNFSNQTDMGLQTVTGSPDDRAKFKIVSLRNIAVTPPYMHDGRFATLEEVVSHYNSNLADSPNLDAALRPTLKDGLQLNSQQVADLVAFLHALTDDDLLPNPKYASPF